LDGFIKAKTGKKLKTCDNGQTWNSSRHRSQDRSKSASPTGGIKSNGWRQFHESVSAIIQGQKGINVIF
jgi:hypothetical protein